MATSDDDRALLPRASVARALALALVLVAACERDPTFELFSVTEISAERLDAGRTVSLRGSGFPVGRDVEVVLDGTLHGPLGAVARVHHVMEGRTATPERVDVLVSDADVAHLGGRGTFEGSIEVVVPGAPLDGRRARVVGTLWGVVLDVVPSERRMHTTPESQGLELAALLGLGVSPRVSASELDEELDEEAGDESGADALSGDGAAPAQDDASSDDEAPGVRVLEVTADAAARRLGLLDAGLVPGARILSIDGMRVLGPRELRVDLAARASVLRIARLDGSEASIRVDVDAALGRRRTTSYRYDQLAAIVLVAAALFGAWPRGRARAVTFRAPGGPGERPYASLVTGTFAIVVVLTASALAPPAAASFPIWLGVALFLRAGSALALGREDGVSVPPSAALSPSAALGLRPSLPALPSLPAELGRAWRGALSRESFVLPASALGATLAIGVFVTAAGSTEGAAIPLLGGPLASAPWMPMSWPLVRSGFGPIALISLLAAAAATTRPLARPASRQARVLRGLDDLGLAMMASTFVRVAVADPGSTDVVTRATGLLVTVALYAGLVRARGSGASLGAPARAALSCVLSLATAGAAALWLSLDPEPATEQAVAEVVVLAVGLVVVRVASLGHRAESLPDPRSPAGVGQGHGRAA